METTITILLVGETGVGKSTFINGFVNYLRFNTMKDAINDMKCVIPTQFTVHDMKDRKLKKVYFGGPDPENEGTDSTQSCTKNCKCYTFKFESFTLKIIDTPGIGDTNGVINDNINMRNLLAFISQYKEINAICVLLKPNNARLNVVFKYCILQIIAYLDKSASHNIVFMFTSARGTDYRPGDTAPALQKVLKAIKSRPPNVEIKFDEYNTYCLDNEGFRYLVAVSEPNNIKFEEKFVKNFEESWIRSSDECQRMLSYIRGLKPHLVEDTITINNIRQKIILLQKSIGDIAKNISDEITKCEIQRKTIIESKGEIEELKKELYIPTFYTDSKPLKEPMTVCIDPKCREEKVKDGVKKFHYNKICHNPCYLKQNDGNIMGNTGLLDCHAFNRYEGDIKWWHPILEAFIMPDHKEGLYSIGKIFGEHSNRRKSENCFECGHSYRKHLYETYETQIFIQEFRDEDKFKLITDKKKLFLSKRVIINKLKVRIIEMKGELHSIADTFAEFACFLQNNALTPYNDSLEEYITYLIDNQKSGLMFEDDDTIQTIKSLEVMLEEYQNEKESLLNAIKSKDTDSNRISSENINEKFTQLFKLKNNGNVIKRHYEMQKLIETSIHTFSKEKEFDLNSGKGSKLFENLMNWKMNFKTMATNLIKGVNAFF